MVGVIGDPVAHSLSPLLHNTAFAELGLDWVSVGFPVPAGRAGGGPGRGAGPRASRGLSVTMPHKDAAAGLVDRRTPLADRLGAVNCVVDRRATAGGARTPTAPGFVAALRRGGRFDPDGRRCLVVGAGGAARAVIAALAEPGPPRWWWSTASPERAASAAALAGPAGRVGGRRRRRRLRPGGQRHAAGHGRADRRGPAAPAWPVDPALLHAGQVVVDLVYHPAETPWMAAARGPGATVANGLGMLVHQAALQLAAWTGQRAPGGGHVGGRSPATGGPGPEPPDPAGGRGGVRGGR